MPRPRVGSAFWHVDHFDIQITLPPGKRSRRACLPVGIGEADARAEAARLSRLAAKHGGRLVDDEPDEEGETLEAWGDRWWDARKAKGILVEAETPRWQKWILSAPVRKGRRLGELPIAAITREDVEDVVSFLDDAVRAEKLSWKTARNAYALLTKALKDAKADKNRALRVRTDNPAADVRPPEKGQKRTKAWLRPTEVTAVLACPDVALELRRAIALNVYLYVRPGELRALGRQDFDLEAGGCSVHRSIRRDGTEKGTKTDAPRTVPIEPTLLPLVAALCEAADADGPLVELPSDTALADVLRAALRTAGVTRPELFTSTRTRKQITWYDLRATGITWRAIRGDNPMAIMEQAGHEDFKTTTQNYIRTASALGAKLEVFPPLPPELYETPGGVSLRETLQSVEMPSNVVGRQGLEPWTYGLKVRSSTD